MIITITLNAALDRTQRIEHPLQVGKLNRAVSSHLEPGGKGINVSRAIKALGGSSIALGFSAGTNGRIMKDMLTAADIHHDFVDIAGQLRVNTQIIDAQGGHTEVNEPGNKLDDSDFLRLLDRMENYLDEGNIFVLSGSTPPEFPLKNYRKLCKTIKKHGCKLIIDAQGELLQEALECEPDFVKPNIFELAEAVGDKPSADPGGRCAFRTQDAGYGRKGCLRFHGSGGRSADRKGRAGVAVRYHQPENLRRRCGRYR